MFTDTIKGNWKQLKGKVHSQWGLLTNDEIAQMKGNTEELIGVLQQKYGFGKDKAKEEINKFLKDNDLGSFSFDGFDAEAFVQKAVDEFNDYSGEAKEAIEEYASKNLFKSLGFAALVGAAIVFFIKK